MTKYTKTEIEMINHLNNLQPQKVKYAVITYKKAMEFLEVIETNNSSTNKVEDEIRASRYLENLLSLNVFGYSEYQSTKQPLGRLKELRKFREFIESLENKLGMSG